MENSMMALKHSKGIQNKNKPKTQKNQKPNNTSLFLEDATLACSPGKIGILSTDLHVGF